jgi:pimeloyl-ACP methyl ester carboxylesterase
VPSPSFKTPYLCETVREILIQGIDTSLGSHFAAMLMRSPDIRISYLPAITRTSAEEVSDRISFAAAASNRNQEDSHRQQIADRLRKHDTLTMASNIAEVWYFADEASGVEPDMLNELVIACLSTGTERFYYASEDLDVGPGQPALEAEIVERCKACGIQYTIFHLSPILGDGGALEKFLAELHSLKTEIEARAPQYFDFQALRYTASTQATLNLLSPVAAAHLLAGFARSTQAAESSYVITSRSSTKFSALCETIGITYGISLLPVEDDATLNAVDRSFGERTVDFRRYLTIEAAAHPAETLLSNVELFVEEAVLDQETQIAAFQSIRQRQENALAIRRKRIEQLPERLARKTLNRSGFPLDYYSAGTGEQTIIILNAIGQGLEYWYPLLHELIEDYRVVIWEPRGTVFPPPPFGLEEQVNDVEAIVQEEAIENCHLIGWCTGPKVAIDFYLRHPDLVQSMAFLNGTFKCVGSPEELDSPYEHNLESLCRLLVRKPAMADSVMKTLMARVEQGEVELLEGADAEQMSVSVLSRANPSLGSYLLAPFKTNATTVNYAHQLVDFWAQDARPKASAVRVPVLLVATEYDQVATPQASEQAAALFPNSQCVLVRGATHYCLYDRPQFVANLLRNFFCLSSKTRTPKITASPASLAAHASVV